MQYLDTYNPGNGNFAGNQLSSPVDDGILNDIYETIMRDTNRQTFGDVEELDLAEQKFNAELDKLQAEVRRFKHNQMVVTPDCSQAAVNLMELKARYEIAIC